MWANHIENEVDKAGENIKDGKQKQIVKQLKLTSLLTDPKEESEESEVPKGVFRDPASMF